MSDYIQQLKARIERLERLQRKKRAMKRAASPARASSKDGDEQEAHPSKIHSRERTQSVSFSALPEKRRDCQKVDERNEDLKTILEQNAALLKEIGSIACEDSPIVTEVDDEGEKSPIVTEVEEAAPVATVEEDREAELVRQGVRRWLNKNWKEVCLLKCPGKGTQYIDDDGQRKVSCYDPDFNVPALTGHPMMYVIQDDPYMDGRLSDHERLEKHKCGSLSLLRGIDDLAEGLELDSSEIQSEVKAVYGMTLENLMTMLLEDQRRGPIATDIGRSCPIWNLLEPLFGLVWEQRNAYWPASSHFTNDPMPKMNGKALTSVYETLTFITAVDDALSVSGGLANLGRQTLGYLGKTLGEDQERAEHVHLTLYSRLTALFADQMNKTTDSSSTSLARTLYKSTHWLSTLNKLQFDADLKLWSSCDVLNPPLSFLIDNLTSHTQEHLRILLSEIILVFMIYGLHRLFDAEGLTHNSFYVNNVATPTILVMRDELNHARIHIAIVTLPYKIMAAVHGHNLEQGLMERAFMEHVFLMPLCARAEDLASEKYTRCGQGDVLDWMGDVGSHIAEILPGAVKSGLGLPASTDYINGIKIMMRIICATMDFLYPKSRDILPMTQTLIKMFNYNFVHGVPREASNQGSYYTAV